VNIEIDAFRTDVVVQAEHLDDVSPESIDLYIHRLRKKLTGSGVRITTLRGLGYAAAR
jgi:DNA-binding response OmpR family regulator